MSNEDVNVNLIPIHFTEGIIAEDTNGFIALIDGTFTLKLVETGLTKKEALEAIITSLKVLLAYHNDIKI